MSAIIEHLREYSESLAALTETEKLSYSELAELVSDAALALGERRCLVMVEAQNNLSPLVHYLATLAANHVVLPVPPGRDHATIVRTFEPDIVIDGDGIHHRGHARPLLHDDLALLL